MRIGMAMTAVLALVSHATACTRPPDASDTSDASTTTVTKPMTDAARPHHEIDYIELTVTDMAVAQRFYAAAFGWQFTDYGPDYAGIRKSGGGEAGGLRVDSTVSTGGPLIILYSHSLESTLAGVRAAGGRVTKDVFSFPGGRRFEFLDPSGNQLAVWSDR